MEMVGRVPHLIYLPQSDTVIYTAPDSVVQRTNDSPLMAVVDRSSVCEAPTAAGG